MSSDLNPVDLNEVAEGLLEVTKSATTSGDVGTMLAVASMQISLAIAQDTRRQADATVALVKELHALRRSK